MDSAAPAKAAGECPVAVSSGHSLLPLVEESELRMLETDRGREEGGRDPDYRSLPVFAASSPRSRSRAR